MDHARKEALEASKLRWDEDNKEQEYVSSLFKFILKARLRLSPMPFRDGLTASLA